MSQDIQEQLHKQQEVIADKQMSVKEDLDKVEPAVIEAQNGGCGPRGESVRDRTQKPPLAPSDCLLL